MKALTSNWNIAIIYSGKTQSKEWVLIIPGFTTGCIRTGHGNLQTEYDNG